MSKAKTIKLPLEGKGINADSIWKTIIAIAETGSTFTVQQLSNSTKGVTKNLDNLSRMLSYIKFLGIIDESRGRNTEQKFTISKNKEVTELIYEIKAKRIEEARIKWNQIITSHPMFSFIVQDFFKDSFSRTFVDLEHFLKDHLPDKDPSYYQFGGKFVMDILERTGIIRLESNHIYLNKTNEEKNEVEEIDNIIESSLNDTNEENLPALKPETKNGYNHLANNSITIKDEYYIMIKTPNFNFDGKIEGPIQIKLIEGILQTIKAELNIND